MISVVITTYGDNHWRDLAWSRAYPSAMDQGAQEIIVHHEPDLPIGPARNAAALLASGEHLCFLDADDELASGYLDAMTRAIESTPNPLTTLFYPTVRYMMKNRAQPDLLRPVGDLRHDNFMVIGTVVGRELFQSVGGFSNYPHGFEDFSAWAKCWKQGAKIHPVRDAVYIAHINPQSRHRTMWRDRKRQVYWHQRVQHELFPDEFPEPAVPPGVAV